MIIDMGISIILCGPILSVWLPGWLKGFFDANVGVNFSSFITGVNT